MYDAKIIRAAIKEGKETLIRVLRTKNMYPPGIYANQIADAVLSIFTGKEPDSVELFFDDIELINQEQEPPEILDELESESEEIDELLEDDYDENYDDKEAIKQSSLKVAEDEGADTDSEG